MNPSHPPQSQRREARPAQAETALQRPVRTTNGVPTVSSRIDNALLSTEPAHAVANVLSPIVHQVVEGFMDSLRSAGEGVLPIVLVLQPELSTNGVAESDAEFARRGRRQSVAERRFFRSIEVALRDALGTILDRAAHAAIGDGNAGLRGRRERKDKTVMAAGGRISPRKAQLHLARAVCTHAE